MAKSSRIRIMISSRCETKIEFGKKPQKLTEVRRELKKQLENYRLPNQTQPLFECWINEGAPGAPGSRNSWDHCLKQAADADFVIVLYTGDAGYGSPTSSMGICHAELEAAINIAADRVRVIKLPAAPVATNTAQKTRDENFKKFFDSLGHFRTSASTGEQVLENVWNEVQSVLVDLVQVGSRSFRLSQSSTGQALNWHRLSYDDRKKAMEHEITTSLLSQAKAAKSTTGVLVEIGSKQVFLKIHASPASLSEPTAREMVGQPFLTDHKLHAELTKVKAGPIHIVACPKGVTENQALNMLGFPDATIVSDSFGIHIADNIQKIQIVLLKECVSPSAIGRQLAEWFEFLRRTGEDRFVLDRAQKRFRIIEAIAQAA